MQTYAEASLASEFEERLAPWRSRLVPRLQPIVERHHQSLLTLVQSLEQAGHGPEVIQSCVRHLITIYEADLSAALSQGGTAS